jgi:hypothetical protein
MNIYGPFMNMVTKRIPLPELIRSRHAAFDTTKPFVRHAAITPLLRAVVSIVSSLEVMGMPAEVEGESDWLGLAMLGNIEVFGAFFGGQVTKSCSCAMAKALRCQSWTVLSLHNPRSCTTRLCMILHHSHSFNRSNSSVGRASLERPEELLIYT